MSDVTTTADQGQPNESGLPTSASQAPPQAPFWPGDYVVMPFGGVCKVVGLTLKVRSAGDESAVCWTVVSKEADRSKTTITWKASDDCPCWLASAVEIAAFQSAREQHSKRPRRRSEAG